MYSEYKYKYSLQFKRLKTVYSLIHDAYQCVPAYCKFRSKVNSIYRGIFIIEYIRSQIVKAYYIIYINTIKIELLVYKIMIKVVLF